MADANGQVQRRNATNKFEQDRGSTDNAFENNNADHVAVHGKGAQY